MTNANQAVIESNTVEEQPALVDSHAHVVEEQQHRATFYGLLAALLRYTPDQKLLEDVSALATVEQTEADLTVSMSMLGLAASTCDAESVSDEFHSLFIGLGRGELVPYGSWYMTGFLMEKPLGQLRDDLTALGFQRDEDTNEPEDHIAALCEVMMLLIADGVDASVQSHFFSTHMAEWVERLFRDLSEAKAAVFYRAVGRFGLAYMRLEKEYLSMQV